MKNTNEDLFDDFAVVGGLMTIGILMTIFTGITFIAFIIYQ